MDLMKKCNVIFLIMFIITIIVWIIFNVYFYFQFDYELKRVMILSLVIAMSTMVVVYSVLYLFLFPKFVKDELSKISDEYGGTVKIKGLGAVLKSDNLKIQIYQLTGRRIGFIIVLIFFKSNKNLDFEITSTLESLFSRSKRIMVFGDIIKDEEKRRREIKEWMKDMKKEGFIISEVKSKNDWIKIRMLPYRRKINVLDYLELIDRIPFK